MSNKLKNKSAVVTGGGSGGIGRAIVDALAAEGAGVIVNDIGRDQEGQYIADIVVKEITDGGGKAVASYDSVANMEGGKKIINTAVANFGRIDILVNCAGNFKRIPAHEMKEDDWNSIMDVHLRGHFNCCKAAIPEMMKQKNGKIINFSSRAASGGGGNLAYSAAKAGILGLTSNLAMELKNHGISVNAIIPSADTKLFPGTRPKFTGEKMPSSLWLDPSYLAPFVVYLATDEATPISGQYFYISGGDFCIYDQLLQFPGKAPIFIRKMGKWTIDEIGQVLPQVLGLV